MKSGYGLEVAQELKILRVIRKLQAEVDLDLVPTLLALHALPASFRGRSRQYVDQVIKRLIPLAGGQRSAGLQLGRCRPKGRRYNAQGSCREGKMGGVH